MSGEIARATREAIVKRGWRPGTDVEDRVAFALSRCGWQPFDGSARLPGARKGEFRGVRQQFPLLSYRLDFAWPEVAVCLEADGWYHRNLDVVDRDRARDAALRSVGWWTFRVDWTAGEDEMVAQVTRVSRLVRMMLADETFRDWAKLAQEARK